MTKRTHRVGSLSAGIVLIFFGIMFAVRIFVPSLDYRFILSFWPLVLILIGVELLIATFTQNDAAIKYDGGSIAILLLLTLFSMLMATAELLLNYYYVNFL